jgi:hypothetical protein
MNRMKTKLIVSSVIIVITAITLWIVYQSPSANLISDALDRSRCEDEQRALPITLYGLVTRKFRDKESHMWETIEYRNNEGLQRSLIFMNDRSGAFDYLMVGDSVQKASQSLDVRIVRAGNQVSYDLAFGCNDSK